MARGGGGGGIRPPGVASWFGGGWRKGGEIHQPTVFVLFSVCWFVECFCCPCLFLCEEGGCKETGPRVATNVATVSS